jgi:hypothetical protein
LIEHLPVVNNNGRPEFRVTDVQGLSGVTTTFLQVVPIHGLGPINEREHLLGQSLDTDHVLWE